MMMTFSRAERKPAPVTFTPLVLNSMIRNTLLWPVTIFKRLLACAYVHVHDTYRVYFMDPRTTRMVSVLVHSILIKTVYMFVLDHMRMSCISDFHSWQVFTGVKSSGFIRLDDFYESETEVSLNCVSFNVCGHFLASLTSTGPNDAFIGIRPRFWVRSRDVFRTSVVGRRVPMLRVRWEKSLRVSIRVGQILTFFTMLDTSQLRNSTIHDPCWRIVFNEPIFGRSMECSADKLWEVTRAWWEVARYVSLGVRCLGAMIFVRWLCFVLVPIKGTY